jgi:hypothetical protein
MSLNLCSTSLHRHAQTCARCGPVEGSVESMRTRDGRYWPPMCGKCSALVREKSTRMAAVAAVEGLVPRTDCE